MRSICRLAEGIAAALDELDSEDALSVGVLTGAGKGFCAGMDLKAFVTGERPWVGDRGFAGIVRRGVGKAADRGDRGFRRGWWPGGGARMRLDRGGRGAKLGIPEVKRSLVAAGGALLRLPRSLPYNVAMELALTGEPLLAERACDLGLVNRLAEPGAAVEVALGLAREIAANAPLALAASKRILQEQWDWSSAEMWEAQSAISDPVFASEDAREGATAFSEKRPPVWRAR